MGRGELAGWFGLAAGAMAVLCGVAATIAAAAGYVTWKTPVEAAGIGAGFGFMFALVYVLPSHWQRNRERFTRPYEAPSGAAKWANAIMGVVLLAIPVGIVTVGAHVDQSVKPGGRREFDTDLHGKHVRAESPLPDHG